MKTLRTLAFTFLLIFTQLALAASDAGYFRVWQGFKLPHLSNSAFNNSLPSFMNTTVSLYGEVLNQYLVAVPPSYKPDFIPDEFALIALTDETSYREIRATPEGQAYGESHWQLFDKSISKSLPLSVDIPDTLESNQSYNLISEPTDWTKGVTTFYLGLRKSNLPANLFLKYLSDHVQLATLFLKPMGLRGYIVIANDNYEAAYMNWESEEAMNQAFSSEDGKLLAADAASIMDTLQWSPNSYFNGFNVSSDMFYKTKGN